MSNTILAGVFGRIMAVATGIVLTMIAEHLAWPSFRRAVVIPVRRIVMRRRDVKISRRLTADGESIMIGGKPQFILEFAPSGFGEDQLTGRLRSDNYDLAEEFRASPRAGLLGDFTTLMSDVKHKRTELASPMSKYWNGSLLAPVSINRRRLPDVENPELHIEFIEKDYANFITVGELFERLPSATKESAFGIDKESPDSLLSTDFGLIINVETADGKVLVARRGDSAYSWNGFWHVAVAESVSRHHVSQGGAIDFYEVIRRGLREELGIKLSRDNVFRRTKIHTCSNHLDRYSWMLLAHINLSGSEYTLEQIKAGRAVGAGQDFWESRDLRGIKFDHETVLGELKIEAEWVPYGLLCLLLSAAVRFPRKHDELLSVLTRS